MKRLIILAAAAIAVGAAAPAIAADLPARPPAAYSKAPAIVAAAYDWSGFYAGINGGGATCPYQKLNPDVLVMQSTQDWRRQNTADGLDRTGYRRILIQG